MSEPESVDYSSPHMRQFAPPDWGEPGPEPEQAPEAVAVPAPPARVPSAEDYPFNPALRIEMQVGLDRLRCVPDREMAQQLFQLHQDLEPKWKDGTAARWLAQERREKETKELEYLRALAERAMAGGLGDPAKQLAMHLLNVDSYKREVRDDLRSLQEFEIELKKLRGVR